MQGISRSSFLALRTLWCGKPNGGFPHLGILSRLTHLFLLQFKIVQRTFDLLFAAFRDMSISLGSLNASVS